MKNIGKWILGFLVCALFLMPIYLSAANQEQDRELEKIKKFEDKVKEVTKKVVPAYVFFQGGSGVLISADGYLLTNGHVIAGVRADLGSDVPIHITGGRAFTARVVGLDPKGDIALLKIRRAKDLPYLEFGDSDKVRTGEFVIMVGIPFMLGTENWEPTVTFGIVSAKNVFHGRSYADSVQTDAAGNPGNSGGPLITMEGKLVGINGMIAVRHGLRSNTGVTYAVPINQIKRFLPYLKRGGRVYHGAIDGLIFTGLDNEAYNQDNEYGEYGDGALVCGIYEDSVAEEAGLKVGDVIQEIDGLKVVNEKRFRSMLFTYPNDPLIKIKVKVRRKLEGGKFTVFEREIPLGTIDRLGTDIKVDVGFRAAPDSPVEGVEVSEVYKDSPAESAGLKPGDLIKEVDGKAIKSVLDFKQILEKKSPGDEIKLKVERETPSAELGGELKVETLDITLKLGKAVERKVEPKPGEKPPDEEKPEDIW